MAGSAVVGALRVTLGLDSAQFTAGMKSAQTGLQRFGSMAKTGALAIGAAMLAAGTATAAAMKGIIDEADKMSKLSQAIGVPIGELSRMGYAADLAGVDIDALGKAVKRLSANMLDSTETATGPAARAFTMLGISVKDAEGKMKPASQVIAELSGKFARMPDGVEKTALAMRIFGKTGADMIPLLNGGAEAMQAAYVEAEQLGIVLDEQTGRAAEAFNDNLTRLGKVKDGIVTKITAGMLPALVNLSNAFVATAKNNNVLKQTGNALGLVMNSLVAVAVSLAAAIMAVGHAAAASAKATRAFWTGDFAGAVQAMVVGGAKIGELTRATMDFNRELFNPTPDTSGFDSVVEGYETVAVAAGGARAAAAGLTDEQKAAADAARDLAREGQRTFEQTRTPAEQYAARIEELRRQLQGAAIDQDTFNRAMRDAQDAFDAADPGKQAQAALDQKIKDYGNDSQLEAIALADDHQRNMEAATYDGIRGGLEAAADGNLGQYLASRLRSALLDGLADSLTSMISGGKKGKGGGGGIFGSLAGLFGIKLPGFKTGGSFKVGGSGGPDSQITAFRSSPGEMVDVRKGDQGGGAMSVHVTPSPYFDVQVQRVAGPVAQQAAGQMGRQVLDASRRSAPGMQSRQSRLGTT